MQLFYDPEILPGPHQLRASEAQHAARVLRKRVGDTIDVVDGKGGWFTATIDAIDKRSCHLTATEVRREKKRAGHVTHLLVAPTKNTDRFEWILEKATEIGVDIIQPILTEHSERKRIRTDRLERVLESAMKQSLRAWLPELGDLRPLEEVLPLHAPGNALYLAYLGEQASPLLIDTYQRGTGVTLVIGPEGGFSAAEAEMAKQSGYEFVSLGPNRLRTETAAITAVQTVESLNW